jgi:hypothetical protein
LLFLVRKTLQLTEASCWCAPGLSLKASAASLSKADSFSEILGASVETFGRKRRFGTWTPDSASSSGFCSTTSGLDVDGLHDLES